jgi:hypothetical protein
MRRTDVFANFLTARPGSRKGRHQRRRRREARRSGRVSCWALPFCPELRASRGEEDRIRSPFGENWW